MNDGDSLSVAVSESPAVLVSVNDCCSVFEIETDCSAVLLSVSVAERNPVSVKLKDSSCVFVDV